MRQKILILIIMAMLASTEAMAQTYPASGPRDQLGVLIEEALKNNPQLRSARELWQAARKRVPQASALPDPTAGYDFMGPMLETANGPVKERYEFEQMIPFPGKLVARRNAARQEALAAQARMRQVERGLIFKVSQAYYDLVTTQKVIAVAQETKAALKQEEASLQARYASNQITQSDLVKVQIAVSDVIQRLFVFQQKKETLEALLQALLNRSVPLDIAADELRLPAQQLSLENIERRAMAQRPQLKEAAAMAFKGEHELSLARLENAPDFSVGFQYSRIGAGETASMNDGKDSWMIPVKITLPIWQNRIGSAIEEAQANLNAARAQLQETANMTSYEVKAAYFRYMSSYKTALLYESALLPQARLMVSSDKAGYEAGRGGISGYVASRVNFLNIQTAYYGSLADALNDWAFLEQEIGENLIEENSHETAP